MICGWCDELGAVESMPMVGVDETGTFWYHRECELRNVLGGLKHARRQCPCFGGTDNDPPDGMTRRSEAREIARLVEAGKWNYG
jgi:hypothetical protein